MNTLDAIFRRRAVRAFKSFELNEGSLRFMIKAATMAPSTMNAQPWGFVVVRGRKRLRQIAQAAANHALESNHLPENLQHSLRDGSFDMFYGAPAVVVICATNQGGQALEDCAMAAQNLLLAAHEYEHATCCIGLARGWMDSAEGRKALRLPQDWTPVIPVAIGYPNASPVAPARMPAQIHWVDDIDELAGLRDG